MITSSKKQAHSRPSWHKHSTHWRGPSTINAHPNVQNRQLDAPAGHIIFSHRILRSGQLDSSCSCYSQYKSEGKWSWGKRIGSFTHVLWWICFWCSKILGISFDMQLVAPGPTLRLWPHNFPYQKYRRKPRAASWLKRKISLAVWHHNINSLRIYHGICTMETSELIPICSKRIIALYMHILRKTEVEVVSPGILVIYKEVALLCAPAGSLPLQAPQGQSMLSPELGHHRSRKWSKVTNSGPFSYSRPSGLRDSSTLCGCMKNYVGLVFISQNW